MGSLVAPLLTGAALALARVALAQGSDDQFLSALAAAGIPAHDGIPAVIAHGHNVCDALGGGMSPGEAANELAQHAYAEDPSHPFEQYLRTMQAFVRVSTQTFCPGRAGAAAYHHGGRVILVGLNVPSPPPRLPDVPDVIHFVAPFRVRMRLLCSIECLVGCPLRVGGRLAPGVAALRALFITEEHTQEVRDVV